MRRRFVVAAAVAVAALSVAARAQPPLARSLVADGRAMDYARGLTAIGSRLTGSANYERAAEWAAGELRAAGIERVGFEPFSIPDGWERERASARLVAPIQRPLEIAALGWTPSLAGGEIEADIVAVNDLTPERIAAQQSLSGRVVLLPSGDTGGNPATQATRRRALDAALRTAGVRAILSADLDTGNSLSARDRTFGAAIGALPAAQIGRDDAATIRELMNRGPVRIAIELRNRVTPGPITVRNVIAELRGRERPDEWVIVGAHLDSWDFAAGAQDNATGVAMVLDAARAIAALPDRPRRSIRFALWGAEEQGQLGSTAYVRAHDAELGQCVANLNSDAGTGRLIGWTAPGRADVVSAVRPLVEPLLTPIGGITFDQSMRYAFQSDGAPFIRAGIPTLDLNADDSRYEEIHHKATDTIGRVDVRQMAAGAIAATAYAIADAPGRVAARKIN
jgi:carboxypeptidase Q